MVNTATYQVQGMHCASCVSLLERKILKIPGINSVSVNLATETAIIKGDTPDPIKVINNVIKPFGYAITAKTSSKPAAAATLPPAFIVAAMAFFLMLWEFLSGQHYAFILFTLASINLFLFGRQFIVAIPRFIKTGYANMDTLVGIGTLTAYTYSTFILFFNSFASSVGLPDMDYFDVTAIVIGFILLGKHLEANSRLKTGEAIQKLIALQAKTAIVIKNNQQTEIPVNEVNKGDHLLVKPGAKIPLDGVIIEGSTAVDESAITGESMPAEKKSGDDVVGGTINTYAAITVEVTKVGDDTVLAQIIKMVSNAQASKAPIERLADKVSSIFVPIILVIAALTLLTWLILGHTIPTALTSFVAVLVIACPCAMGLATPTGIIAGVGKGAENGILIKDAESLEKLHKVDVIVMDKTGTLTIGKPAVSNIVSKGDINESNLIQIAASLESLSDHPLARAIVLKNEEYHLKLLKVSGFTNFPGMGVMGKIDANTYLIGNQSLMDTHKINTHNSGMSLENGSMTVYLAQNNKLIGLLSIKDTIRKSAIDAIFKLKQSGVTVVMATGDNESSASAVGRQVGISEIYSGILPQDKVKIVKKFQLQNKRVAMIGDGINDAPALATADVGIAMSNGSDIAIESANITLLHGDISKIWKAIELSKITMSIIKQNLFWAFIYNSIGVPLAATNLLSPVIAGSAMALSSVSVVTNSLRLKSKSL